MIEIREFQPNENCDFRIQVIVCSSKDCTHNKDGRCIHGLPSLKLPFSSYMPMSCFEPPCIQCFSYEKKQKEIEKDNASDKNFKLGKFFNPHSNKPHERHCARLDCAHLERPYRTCDIVPNIQSSKPFGNWDRCYSFEPRKEDGKEESKMSDVKITYKPVDKKDALRHLLACEDTFRGGDIAAEDMVRKIDSIYNTKEEDGEIDQAEISKGKFTFLVCNSFWPDTPIILQIEDGIKAMAVGITKQEALELGQALIKMSEQ